MKRLMLLAAMTAAPELLFAQTETATVIARVVASRNPRHIVVVPSGQYFHRFDHLVTESVIELTPEAARDRLYSRCFECLPPETTGELNDEVDRPKLTRYYKNYLVERNDPSKNAPPGALPRSEPAAAGSGAGRGGGGGGGGASFVAPPVPGGANR